MMFRHAALAVLLAAAPTLAADPQPFTVHDMLAMERISDPQASPDGTRILFQLRTTDLEANRGRNDLWLVGADARGLRRLTDDPASDTNGRWGPDGRTVYFLSTRGGSSQVWKLDADAGGSAGTPSATQVTELPLDVSALELSPDGTRLALSVEVFPDCADLACTKDRLAAVAARPASGRIYDSAFVRHWDTWADGRRNHLFVAPVTGGGAVDVTRGMHADVPSKPFGGPEEFAFTPDGRSIVFAARDAGRQEPWSTNFDLFVAPVDGSAPPRRLTSNIAWDTHPAFSPDGRTLAYLAMSRAGYEADRYRILLREGLDGTERELAAAWDRSPNELVWSRDGKTIYATAQDVGQVSLFAIDVATGEARALDVSGTNHTPVLLAGGKVGYGKDHLRGPQELWSIDPTGGDPVRLTRINDARVDATRMGRTEQMSFRGAHGDTVFSYIVEPIDFDPARKYPVAFLIHGGPQGSFGNNFHYRWNPQVYAARGYAVVMVDFHGSTGYGQAFTDAIRGDWGGAPFEDLKLGLDAALAAYPWMDGERVAALGASYGGWMIHWIAGNWPDRFRAHVAHDGFLDSRFSYFTTEELWFPEWEFRGTPWENPELYERWNPVRFVDRWRTPTLIVHGALDFRVVETDGIGAFNALQRRGIPSRFLYLPDENHWVLKPHNSILWHETVLDWIDQWTKGAAAN
jgi:dipeptidyl aminopeptidase/acylaminoacyl peptidase